MYINAIFDSIYIIRMLRRLNALVVHPNSNIHACIHVYMHMSVSNIILTTNKMKENFSYAVGIP